MENPDVDSKDQHVRAACSTDPRPLSFSDLDYRFLAYLSEGGDPPLEVQKLMDEIAARHDPILQDS